MVVITIYLKSASMFVALLLLTTLLDGVHHLNGIICVVYLFLHIYHLNGIHHGRCLYIAL
jgi:hypothetical protein